MPRTGRPRSLTTAKRGQAELLVSLGWKLKAVADYVGCAPCTLRREVLRNPQFQEGIETSKQGFRAEMLRTMIHAAATKSEAARWLEKHLRSTDHVDPFSTAPYGESMNPSLAPPSAIRARKSRSTSAR